MLVAVDVELLPEIALVVEQPDCDERDAQAAGALHVVSREHSQAAGVDRNRLVDPELGREVDDRLGAEHASVDRAPGILGREIFLHPPVGLVDSAVEYEFGGSGIESLRRELREESDRVVVELPPADGIEVAKEVRHLGVPAPPQIAGQGHTLGVERLGREFVEPGRLEADDRSGAVGGSGSIGSGGDRGWGGTSGGVFGLAHGKGSGKEVGQEGGNGNTPARSASSIAATVAACAGAGVPHPGLIRAL